MVNTLQQYDEVAIRCRKLFFRKIKDYGPAWRILRLSSLTDQIFIKAQRIRNIEDKGTQLIADSIEEEFIGIFNYSIIALIKLELGVTEQLDIGNQKVMKYFDKYCQEAKGLMKRKNHDYDEAWRNMRISSFTDLILQKILRIKQIEKNNSDENLVLKGLNANYFDMINYSFFALIKVNEV